MRAGGKRRGRPWGSDDCHFPEREREMNRENNVQSRNLLPGFYDNSRLSFPALAHDEGR